MRAAPGYARFQSSLAAQRADAYPAGARTDAARVNGAEPQSPLPCRIWRRTNSPYLPDTWDTLRVSSRTVRARSATDPPDYTFKPLRSGRCSKPYAGQRHQLKIRADGRASARVTACLRRVARRAPRNSRATRQKHRGTTGPSVHRGRGTARRVDSDAGRAPCSASTTRRAQVCAQGVTGHSQGRTTG